MSEKKESTMSSVHDTVEQFGADNLVSNDSTANGHDVAVTSIPDMNDNSFAQFGLPAALFTNLVKMGFNRPTPIQEQAIPYALEGRDILGSAQTGTGKTAAFAIPVVARLMEDPSAAALIMTPTRELAAQIVDVIHNLLGVTRKNGGNGIRTALLIGGEAMGRQFDQLRSSPRIIVGTPGRINDHLRRDGTMLADVKMVVLDEADRMLDMGFSGQIDDVLNHVQKPSQMLMFSATFAPAIIRFSKTYLDNPQRISIAPENKTARNIRQEVVHTSDAEKYDTLVKELDARTGSIIVFVRTKHGADRLATRLSRENHSADVIHGDLRQNKRDRAIAAFRAGKTRIMVATDVAARGIDVPQIEHVINFDLPQVAEDYVHRIGRTARAGAEGCALSILVPSDSEKWTIISRLLDPTAGRQKTGTGGGSAAPSRGGKKPHRKGGASSGGYAGQDRDRKPSYKKEGGFNDRKRGEGYSAKRTGGDFESKRNERSGSFRKDREDGVKRPRFDREDRPRRFEGAEGRSERPALQGRRDGSQRFGGKEGGERSDRNFRGESHDRFGRKERPQQRAGGNERFGKPRFNEDRAPRGDRFDRNDNRSDRDFRSGDFRDEGKREGRRDGKPGGFGKGGFKGGAQGGFQGKRADGDAPRGKSFGGGKPAGKGFGKKPAGGKSFGGGEKAGNGARRGAGRHQQGGNRFAG